MILDEMEYLQALDQSNWNERVLVFFRDLGARTGLNFDHLCCGKPFLDAAVDVIGQYAATVDGEEFAKQMSEMRILFDENPHQWQK